MELMMSLSSIISIIIYINISKNDYNQDIIDTFFKISLSVCLTMLIMLIFKVAFNEL